MKIEGKNPEPARADIAKQVQVPVRDESDKPAAAPSKDTPERNDSVQISEAGRALAGQVSGESAARPGLSAERTAEIRKKILEGAYDSVGIVDEVARRILRSGDL